MPSPMRSCASFDAPTTSPPPSRSTSSTPRSSSSMPSRDDLLTTDVSRAAQILRRGGLVAIPTETVYGLAADARQPAAVARIFDVKGRPTGHPLIVHLSGEDSIDGWVGDLTESTPADFAGLANACWPGPLTMLVPRGRFVLDVVTGGRPTVGVRVPA